VEFLLVAEQQVAAREAPCALRAFKGLFFGVRALMALEMFETSE